jgi:cell division protein FtsZ
MVDEKLADQVWVTVVATGYGTGAPRQRRVEEQRDVAPRAVESRVSGSLREPRGEPRVSRARTAVSSPTELDVPEFIPRR